MLVCIAHNQSDTYSIMFLSPLSAQFSPPFLPNHSPPQRLHTHIEHLRRTAIDRLCIDIKTSSQPRTTRRTIAHSIRRRLRRRECRRRGGRLARLTRGTRRFGRSGVAVWNIEWDVDVAPWVWEGRAEQEGT